MANLLQKASIVLTPTAYNDGEVLCAKPDDGSGDFDFSRNSAATRINAQGLVENVQILSSNLVQNGDFSEEGVQEVSNGSFSQEGSEELANSNFTNGLTSWNGSGYTVVNNQLITNSSGLFYQVLSLTANKTYKAEINIESISQGGVKFYCQGNQSATITTSGVHTIYIVSGSSNSLVGINPQGTFEAVVNSISFREVGQDWNLGTGWSIAEDKAVFTNANGTLRQSGVWVSGKTYKITCDYNFISGTRLILPYDGNGYPPQALISTPSSVNGYTYYYTPDSNGQLTIYTDGNGNGSITNISVKEVGQNWSAKDGVIVSANSSGLVFDNSTGNASGGVFQNIGLSDANKYQMTATMQLLTGASNGTFRVFSSSANGTGQSIIYTGSTLVVGGNAVTETFEFSPATGDVSIQFFCDETNATYNVSNISVIEITDETNLPRINYEGFSYQDALGSEEIVNGDFSDWTNDNPDNWLVLNEDANNYVTESLSGGKLRMVSDNTSTIQIRQENIITAGVTYKIVVDVTEVISGSIRFQLNNQQQILNSVGLFTFYVTADVSGFFAITRQSACDVTIDNVSVKEYLGQEVVPDSGCGSWLWEPQSTNLVPYSEDFSQSNWSKGGVNIAGGFVSPNGTTNASKITATTTDPYIFTYINVGLGEVTFSFYAKADEPYVGRFLFWQIGTAVVSGSTSQNFTLSNKWERYEATVNITTAGTLAFRLDFPINDGGNVGEYGYLWGAQVEQQSYATSYIPTSGATVTRNQDLCNNGGSLASINSTEGVLYAEIAALANDSTDKALSINNGGFTDRIWLGYSTAASRIYAIGYTNNVLQFVMFKNLPTDTDMIKVAVKYKENDFALWVNGIEEATDTSGLTPIGLNSVDFSINGFGTQNFFGKTKALAVWKEALSDQELADLTYPTPTDPTFALDFDTIATDFTFARGSEATYVDAQGLIKSTNELGPEEITNGDFATDSDWSKATGWSIANGTATYDGTGGTSALIQNGVIEINKTYKVTIDVISNEGSGANTIFLGNNTINTQHLEVGSYTFYGASTSGIGLAIYGRSGEIFKIDNVSVKEYITETNTPRLDYSTGAEAFLLEPQSTNVINYSSDFTTGTGWAEARCTLDSNVLISPDGQQTASELTDTTAPGDRGLSQINSSLASNDYALFSMFLKAGTNRYGLLYLIDNAANINGGANSFTIVIDLQDGIITDTGIKQGTPQNTTYGIESYNNGWYRVYIGLQKQGNSTRTDLRFLMYNSSTWSAGQGYVGDGTGTNYIWGGQLEAQSYPTSYIPTNGSQTTRNQEQSSKNNVNELLDGNVGSIYLAYDGISSNGTTLNNMSPFRLYGQLNNKIRLYYAPDADFLGTSVSFENGGKIAWSCNGTTILTYVDGVLIDTHTITNNFTTLSNFVLSTSFMTHRITDIKIYPKALLDAELIKLTT